MIVVISSCAAGLLTNHVLPHAVTMLPTIHRARLSGKSVRMAWIAIVVELVLPFDHAIASVVHRLLISATQ